MKEIAARAVKAGVPILAGTDVAGADVLARHEDRLLRELEILVELGLAPREALAAATTAPAEVLGRRGPGRVAAAAPASLLIVAADPMASIANLRALEVVILRGRVIEKGELAALRELKAP